MSVATDRAKARIWSMLQDDPDEIVGLYVEAVESERGSPHRFVGLDQHEYDQIKAHLRNLWRDHEFLRILDARKTA